VQVKPPKKRCRRALLKLVKWCFLLFYHLRNMYFSHRKVMYALFFGVCVLTNPFIYLTKEIGW